MCISHENSINMLLSSLKFGGFNTIIFLKFEVWLSCVFFDEHKTPTQAEGTN